MSRMEHIPRPVDINHPRRTLLGGRFHPRAELTQHAAGRQKFGRFAQRTIPVGRGGGDDGGDRLIVSSSSSYASSHDSADVAIEGGRRTRHIIGASLAVAPRARRILRHVMILGQSQHPPDDIGGAHPLRPRHALILPRILGRLVHVPPVHDARIVPVHHVIDVQFFDHVFDVFGVHHVRTSGHDLVDESTSAHHGQPFGIVHEGRSLAAGYGFVRIHAHDEMRPQGFAEAERVHVPVVHHVEGAVHEDSDLPVASFGVVGGGGVGGDVLFLGGEETFFQFVHLKLGHPQLLGQPPPIPPVPLPHQSVIPHQGPQCRERVQYQFVLGESTPGRHSRPRQYAIQSRYRSPYYAGGGAIF
mmetsp:Transcript_29545/g.87514  ORF Transcript_29545/g.87514 Transcript_29545/m.87514 type:complete len:358 (+) Transcript_29545:743-1816(+)